MKNTLIFLCLVLSFTAQAQNKITMQASIDSALHNNLMLNGEYLNVQYWQAIKNTSYNFSPLTINSEYGQINSIFTDTRFGVNQAFALPSTYSRQKQLGSIKVGVAQNAFTLKSAELKQEIRSQYFRYIYLHQQEILLKSADSFFTAMLESAEIKLKLGETNTLERDYMKLQQFQVARQLEQVITDKANVLLAFQTLINTKEKYIPNDAVDNYIIIPQFSDTHFLNSHPTVKAAQLMISENKQLVKTEKSQLLPYLNLGYSNMSIQGIGSDNKTYNSSDRFQSVQLAINVPVFAMATKARIQAYGVAVSQSETALSLAQQQLKLQWETAWKNYENAVYAFQWYKNTGIKTANEMLQTASQQYIQGEIDYLQFATIANQTLSIKSSNAEAEFNYYNSIIALNAITNP